MKPPSLFEKMRNNRLIASGRVAWDGLKQDVAATTELAHQDPTPAPTMEVYGVKYREQPEAIGCYGCAFEGTYCSDRLEVAVGVFGGACGTRGVIYIKAE